MKKKLIELVLCLMLGAVFIALAELGMTLSGY